MSIKSIGVDKSYNKLAMGDICSFTIDYKPYEGMIGYESDYFAYGFDMNDDSFPCVLMGSVDFKSIKKIINVEDTKNGDRFGFYRELWNKGNNKE